MNNKLRYIAITITILFILVSCNQSSNSDYLPSINTSGQISSDSCLGNYSIMMFPLGNDDFNNIIISGCKQAVNDLSDQNINVDLSINNYQSYDIPDSIIKDVIANDPTIDSVLLVPWGYSILNDIYKIADQNDTKLIILDPISSDISFSSYYNAAYIQNGFDDGELAAKQMLEQFRRKNIYSGKIVLLGIADDESIYTFREKGFKKIFEGTEYEILDTKYFGGDSALAKEYLNSLLKSDAKNDIVGLISFSDSYMYDIAKLISDNSLSECTVTAGFDIGIYRLYEEDYMYYETGAIDISINTDPYQMGYQGIMGAVELLRGNKINPKKVYIPPIVVTKDNYEEYFDEIDRQVKQSGLL